jgi:hypothetical protein
MRNVGVAVATSAWLLASAGESDAAAVADLLDAAASSRLATERAQGADRTILDAWIKWYEEAFDSVLRLPAGGATDALRRRVAAGKSALSAAR